uniref:CSON010408 protein n=3 Tax=Culicoides sonorensis TaxID=179676 RepID=A0A336M702_CULSO
MEEIENVQVVTETSEVHAENNDAGTEYSEPMEGAPIVIRVPEMDAKADEPPTAEEKKPAPKLEVLENKIIKPANEVEAALKQLQTIPQMQKGRPKKDQGKNEEDSGSDATNGKETAPMFTGRSKLRRTFVTPDELDKELEATMEKLEPGYSIQVVNSSNQAKSIQDQDLIAILEGNDNAEVVSDPQESKYHASELMLEDQIEGENPADCEAEIALQQMMNLPKAKRGRKSKHETLNTSNNSNVSDLVNSIVDDWSDNEVEYEVTAEENKTSNETTITISPAARVTTKNSSTTKTGAAKRKQTQNVVADEAGSVEIIQTIEPPRIINKEAANVASPIKFERRRVIKKKVIWDPDDPAPPMATRIGNTTIKKVSAVKEEKVVPVEEKKIASVTIAKKKRGRSEIDKLLGDEGAINMIYSLERENNSELPEIKTAVEEQLIDVEEEQNNLLKKANALKKAVIKQTKSPPNSIPARAARAKRAPTPTTISPPTPTTTTTSSPAPVSEKKQTAAKKRKPNQNESWDYVYKARQNDDSMIVRRRSNSSYSSTTSPRRLSLDQSQLSDSAETSTTTTTTAAASEATSPNDKTTESSPNQPPTKKQRGKNFEFAKPSAKKSAAKKPMDTRKLVEQIRGKLKPKPMTSPLKNLTVSSPVSGSDSPDSIKRKALDSKQLSIKKYDKFAYLILPSIDGKVKDCLTLQLLNKMIAALKQLENDTLCNAVVITSAGTDFCRGINYNILVQVDEEKRTNAAREFASAVRKFIFALATFPKPLICGLQSGEVSGIGVTILPLFDLVLARDDVKLSAPYGLMGYFPEGLSILRLLNKIKTRTVSELFYCNRTITADEAIEHELVTKTVSKSNFNDDILATARSVVASSTQALLSIKATLTKDLIEHIDEALAEEEQMLIQHWISPECQEKFRNFLNNGHWHYCPSKQH